MNGRLTLGLCILLGLVGAVIALGVYVILEAVNTAMP